MIHRLILIIVHIVHKIYSYFQHLNDTEQKRLIISKFKNHPYNIILGKVGYIHCPQYISIGDNTKLADNIFLSAWNRYSCYFDGKETT